MLERNDIYGPWIPYISVVEDTVTAGHYMLWI
jgi:hypothetical protein